MHKLQEKYLSLKCEQLSLQYSIFVDLFGPPRSGYVFPFGIRIRIQPLKLNAGSRTLATVAKITYFAVGKREWQVLHLKYFFSTALICLSRQVFIYKKRKKRK
jgi:hypothetical protein